MVVRWGWPHNSLGRLFAEASAKEIFDFKLVSLETNGEQTNEYNASDDDACYAPAGQSALIKIREYMCEVSENTKASNMNGDQ